MAGETAEKTGRLIFEEIIEDHPGLRDLAGDLDSGRLRLRTYVIEAAEYKRALRYRGLPDDVVTWHVNVVVPHWIWVVELQDRDAAKSGTRCVLAEIAIDATSDDQWPNPLFGNFPGLTVRWPELGDEIDEADSTQATDPYETGCALHVWS